MVASGKDIKSQQGALNIEKLNEIIDREAIESIHKKLTYLANRFSGDILNEATSPKGLAIDVKEFKDTKSPHQIIKDIKTLLDNKNLKLDTSDQKNTRTYISATVLKLEATLPILEILNNPYSTPEAKIRYMDRLLGRSQKLSVYLPNGSFKNALLAKRGKSHGIKGLANKNASTIVKEIEEILKEAEKLKSSPPLSIQKELISQVESTLKKIKSQKDKVISELKVAYGFADQKINGLIEICEAYSKQRDEYLKVVNNQTDDPKKIADAKIARVLLNAQKEAIDKVISCLKYNNFEEDPDNLLDKVHKDEKNLMRFKNTHELMDSKLPSFKGKTIADILKDEINRGVWFGSSMQVLSSVLSESVGTKIQNIVKVVSKAPRFKEVYILILEEDLATKKLQDLKPSLAPVAAASTAAAAPAASASTATTAAADSKVSTAAPAAAASTDTGSYDADERGSPGIRDSSFNSRERGASLNSPALLGDDKRAEDDKDKSSAPRPS